MDKKPSTFAPLLEKLMLDPANLNRSSGFLLQTALARHRAMYEGSTFSRSEEFDKIDEVTFLETIRQECINQSMDVVTSNQYFFAYYRTEAGMVVEDCVDVYIEAKRVKRHVELCGHHHAVGIEIWGDKGRVDKLVKMVNEVQNLFPSHPLPEKSS